MSKVKVRKFSNYKREQRFWKIVNEIKKQTVEIRVDHISENNANNTKQQKITVKKSQNVYGQCLKNIETIETFFKPFSNTTVNCFTVFCWFKRIFAPSYDKRWKLYWANALNK